MQAQLTEELSARWGQWIDARVAVAMADAIKTMAESIGEVLAKERVRVRTEIEAAITTARTETRLLLADTKSDLLERLYDGMDRRFDTLQRRIIDGVSVARADAETTLPALPSPTQTRQ